MKVNFKQPFKDMNGIPLPTTMADEIGKSLFYLESVGKQPLTADEKYLAYKLCNRIAGADGDVELSTDEAAFILRVCADTLKAGAYGQIRNLIDK